MIMRLVLFIVFPVAFLFVSSCNTIEKASRHGFNSDFYKAGTKDGPSQDVYVNVSEDKAELHRLVNGQPEKAAYHTITLTPSENLAIERMTFQKNSLDIDLTAILLKYRIPAAGLHGQLSTDFNIALYGGWRHDTYILSGKKDPLGITHPKISHRGYDIGLFAGPGAAAINQYSTNNLVPEEYSGLVIQTGIAGFLESNIASFGIAVGLDHLTNPDRKVWIYTNKPWIGFIVGVALN